MYKIMYISKIKVGRSLKGVVVCTFPSVARGAIDKMVENVWFLGGYVPKFCLHRCKAWETELNVEVLENVSLLSATKPHPGVGVTDSFFLTVWSFDYFFPFCFFCFQSGSSEP